jgi:hypothetical protein
MLESSQVSASNRGEIEQTTEYTEYTERGRNHEQTDLGSAVPSGLDRLETAIPALKTLGYFRPVPPGQRSEIERQILLASENKTAVLCPGHGRRLEQVVPIVERRRPTLTWSAIEGNLDSIHED